MVDFSIQALTAPFIPLTNRCFNKITRYIVEKHPAALDPVVDHDLKVITFNAASTLIVATVALAYFKCLALTTAVALTVLFYLVRRIIAESIVPAKEKPEEHEELKNLTAALLAKGKEPAPLPKSLNERVKETFYQGNDIVIGPVILLKMIHHPLPKMIGMIFTRSP